MTFVINVANYRLYFNESGADRVVTVGASAQARFEVKAPTGVASMQLVTGNLGGVTSLRVPSQNFIEVDALPAGIQVEVLDVQ
jgi:hypothetical protein